MAQTSANQLRQRLLHGIDQVRRLRLPELLFNDSDGCQESLRALERFEQELLSDIDPRGLEEVERYIVREVLRHVEAHLASLLQGAEDARVLLASYHAEPNFDRLPDVMQLVQSVHERIARRQPIENLRRQFEAAFADHPDVGERLAVLAGHQVTSGMPSDRVAGLAVLAGPYGSGRSTMVRKFAEAVSHEGETGRIRSMEIDLCDFNGREDEQAQLINALSEIVAVPSNRVIAMDNVETASPSIMATLEEIATTGGAHAGGREVRLDGCFLFFMMSRGMTGLEPSAPVPAAIARYFSRPLLDAVQEIVVVPRPSEDMIKSMVETALIACVKDFDQHVGHRMEIDASMVRSLVKRVLQSGALGHSVASVVKEYVREPMTDRLVRGTLSTDKSRLVHEDGIDLLIHGSNREPLSSNLESTEPPFDLDAELRDLIGLAAIKTALTDLYHHLRAERLRREAGISVNTPQTFHMMFMGNPGSGKTVVARLVARMLREFGTLRGGQLVEVDRSDLVAAYVGQTAIRTRAIIQRALGGVLFVDEAYSLSRSPQDFGVEAIDTLVSEMENRRDDLVVIMAGYPTEMRQFLESNPGLRSRFAYHFEFPDYNAHELARIASVETSRRGFLMSDEESQSLEGLFDGILVAGRSDQGNGRLARTVVETAIRRQAVRIASGGIHDREALQKLELVDFDVAASRPAEDAEVMLRRVIGLAPVKTFVRDLAARAQLDARKRAIGMETNDIRSLHMVFKGNPGTGKTTVARIIARLLKDLKILKGGQLVETDRAGLVGEYLGQTAPKTRARIREALGGVLFIDEAYALVQDRQDMYGREALDTIVKCMEDYRDSLVVILAGYSEPMERLLSSNDGLRSRFPNIITFPDYDASELMEIARGMLAAKNLSVSPEAWSRIQSVCSYAQGHPELGNGRFVRNLIEEMELRQARRLNQLCQPNRDQLLAIEASDVPTDHAPEA